MILPAIGVWPMLEYELDIVQRKLDAGDEVIWLMCDGDAPFCPANLDLKKRICVECKSRSQAGVNWLKPQGRLTLGSFYELSEDQRAATHLWAQGVRLSDQPSAPQVPKDIANLDWYETAFSTLQTTYKEFQPDLARHEATLRNLVLDFFQSYYAFKNNQNRYQPDEVWLFNGRITRYRPALRTLQREDQKVFVYEYPYQGYKRYIVFEGQYVHDFGFRSRTWKKQFDEYPLKLAKKLAIGDTWYRRRLSRIQTNYEKVFSALQVQGLLPDGWISSRCNVTIFNSSEWEASGVPESRRWNYTNQYSAIEQILQDTQHLSNLHFTFRIHPHMAKRDKESAKRFLTLSRFTNVTVLPPESKYDTYALAMASDMVLTFYSLVGVESAWLGRKVISLGPCGYQDFGCVYLPLTHEELIDTLSHPEKSEERFPSIEMRKQGAQEFAFARLFSGVKPRYLLKQHYTRAQMRRANVLTQIRAALPILIFNRCVSMPLYIIDGVRRIREDEFLRKDFLQHPWRAIKRFIQDRIGGLVP